MKPRVAGAVQVQPGTNSTPHCKLMMERTEDDAESLSVSSSGDDEVFIHDIRSSAGPQKRQKREEPVPFELLQQAG